MPYQLMQCPNCSATWNYYDERNDGQDQLTAAPLQGCICPRCWCVDGVVIDSVHRVKGDDTPL